MLKPKFKIGDYVEVIEIICEDKKMGIKRGMIGRILDVDRIPSVNFVDDSINLKECKDKSKNNVLYCYSLHETQLNLIKRS